MTREEAIERIRQNKATAEFYARYTNNDKDIENELKDADAFCMAIEALQTAEINCVHCPRYYETEDDIGVHGHCKGDDG